MNKSESIKSLATALCNFQAEVINPKNTSDNPFFKSKYAPLNEILNNIKPLLAKNGLSVFQSPSGDGQNIVLTTLLMHSSGEWIETDPLILKADKATAQGAGSAITYARRYALSSVLGISSEDDDDGNHASGNKEESKKAEKVEYITDKQARELLKLIEQKGQDLNYITSRYNVKDLTALTEEQYTKLKKWLEGKQDKKSA